jgi:branched-chain amino acid transport system substrate-binding protein
MFSDSQDAIAPYVAEHNVLDIAPIGGSWELSQYDNWIVFPGTLYSFGVPLGDYAYDQGWRTMTTLGADYIAGQRLIGGVADRFKERGGTVVQEQWSPVGELDFAPYLANLADADVFCIWTLPLGATITHYLELGLKIPLVIPEADQLESSSLGEFGDAFLGQVGMVSAYTSRLDNPLNHQFVAALGKDANIMHGSGHVATSILLAGLEATGGDASLEVLRPAILNLVNLDTVAGPISFSPTGNVLSNRYMAEVSFIDGRYVWEPFQVYRDVRDPRE